MTMNRTHEQRELPRYGIREDEMTRPGVVLYDWNSDEATVSIEPKLKPTEEEELEHYEALFRPRWHGVGRTPGATVLGVVLGLCVAIGVFALLESETGSASSANAVDLAQR
jgi:hypothetical protein